MRVLKTKLKAVGHGGALAPYKLKNFTSIYIFALDKFSFKYVVLFILFRKIKNVNLLLAKCKLLIF
jgi:hypothetical protein